MASSILWMFSALPGHEGQADTDPELVWAFHLVLEEQSSGCVHKKSCPREDWQSGILAW